MKKIYAILAAAVVGSAAASAQLPAKSIKDAGRVNLPPTEITASEVPNTTMTKKTATSAIMNGQAVRKAPSRAEELDFTSLSGEYLLTFKNDQSPFSACFLTTNITVDESGNAVVSNFRFNDVQPMAATVAYEEIDFSDGTQTLPVLTIKGLANGPTPYYIGDLDDDGVEDTYYLALTSFIFGEEDGKKVITDVEGLYGMDIKWILYPESGETQYWYIDDLYVTFWKQADGGKWGYGGIVGQSPTFYKKNAEMTAMYYDGEEGFEEDTCPVWTYVLDGNYTDTGEPFKAVFAAGWGGCGEPFHFMIEDLGDDQYIAWAANQTAWTTADGIEFAYCDVVTENGDLDFKWTDDSGDGLNWMVATVGVDGDGNTVFAQDDMWILFNEQVGIVTYWKEGITVFDYYIGVGNGGNTEGVEAIESNDNAPAEYYNLQGVKVANPTSGQLYIVKQGSKVSKVIR